MWQLVHPGEPEPQQHNCKLPTKRQTKQFNRGATIRCGECGDEWVAESVYIRYSDSLMWVRQWIGF